MLILCLLSRQDICRLRSCEGMDCPWSIRRCCEFFVCYQPVMYFDAEKLVSRRLASRMSGLLAKPGILYPPWASEVSHLGFKGDHSVNSPWIEFLVRAIGFSNLFFVKLKLFAKILNYWRTNLLSLSLWHNDLASGSESLLISQVIRWRVFPFHWRDDDSPGQVHAPSQEIALSSC